MGTVRKGNRAGRSGEFLHNKGVLEVALVKTTIFRGGGNAQKTHLAKFLPKVLNVQGWFNVHEVTRKGIPLGKC